MLIHDATRPRAALARGAAKAIVANRTSRGIAAESRGPGPSEPASTRPSGAAWAVASPNNPRTRATSVDDLRAKLELDNVKPEAKR